MSRKTADNTYPIHDLIKDRWSPRAFSDKAVEPEKLQSILEAARWASSSMNEQPWAFVLATKDDPDNYNKLLDCLMEGNRVWAQHAPVLLLTMIKTRFDRNDKTNNHASHDLGLAIGNLVIQATHLGLSLHQMGGFFADKARERFNIPESHQPITAIALGYTGDVERLPENYQEMEKSPRSRKPLKDFIFGGQFGETHSLVK